jgi:hypothetical protein
MFLCAQARPRVLPDGTHSDGKNGIRPVGRWELAVKTSQNRPVGTPLWIDLSINTEVYLDLLFNKVVPAVIEKWPQHDFLDKKKIIQVQHDRAKPHTAACVLPKSYEYMEHLVEIGIAVPWFSLIRGLSQTRLKLRD